jgi:hypothetical protein
MTNQQEFEQLVVDLQRISGGLIKPSYLSEIANKATAMIPLLRQEELSKLVDIAHDFQLQSEQLFDAARDLFDAVSAAEEDPGQKEDPGQEWSDYLAANEIEVNFFERRKKQQGNPAADQPPQTTS